VLCDGTAPFVQMTLIESENFEMFRQKSLIFLAIAAVMAVVIACGGTVADPTATPVPPTPTATSVPPTATPVPLALIELDPLADPVAFYNALPESEASCAADALGGLDRVLAMLESDLGPNKLTAAEADAVDACLSDDTVQAVFVGQLSREAGGLSDATIVCIGEKIGGMSAAGLFTETPAADSIISSLQGIFCLGSEERAAISATEAMYGFGELGGIDALECVVNGVGPTGLEDLMALASEGTIDFSAIGEMFPLFIECGAIEDEQFDELGVTADQIGCVIGEIGEDALTLFDTTATEPDLSQLGPILAALGTCGISIEELLEGATLPIDPDALVDPAILPTAQIEIPENFDDLDLPFTEEQLICLTDELGDEAIANLLSGGAPDLSLFAALATCEVDIATLLGG
jgi:hypothetical protein